MTLKLWRFAVVLLFGAAVAACGSTWEGVKDDTGSNLESVGESIDKAGEDIKSSDEEESSQ
ncbi:MAG: hypothetical protein AAF637_23350 [Pseudomonadota bacterium]